MRLLRRNEASKVLAISSAMLGASVLAGIPAGYFMSELNTPIGYVESGLLAFAANAVLIASLCAWFSRKWPRGAILRVLASFVVVQLFSVGASLLVGAYLSSALVLILEGLMTLAVAVAGAALGRRAASAEVE